MWKILVISVVTVMLCLSGNVQAKQRDQEVRDLTLRDLIRPARYVLPGGLNGPNYVRYIMECNGGLRNVKVEPYQVVDDQDVIVQGKYYFVVTCPLDSNPNLPPTPKRKP